MRRTRLSLGEGTGLLDTDDQTGQSNVAVETSLPEPEPEPGPGDLG